MNREPRPNRLRRSTSRVLLTGLLIGSSSNTAWALTPPNPRFEISFPASARHEAVTGRLILLVSRQKEPEVRFQGGFDLPMFGLDVDHLRPGQTAVVSGSTPGFPFRRLADVPTGDYYVQAVLSVYTEFHRADGRVIWAHMDQWEGQQYNRSPGNLYSRVQKVHLDPSQSYRIKLDLTEVMPPVTVPAETEWVKHVKIQSKLLSDFWGHPIYLGAVVLLPRDYATHPDVQYPVIYQQNHFSLEPAFGFTTEDSPESEEDREARVNLGFETGYQFYRAWSADRFPRMIMVTFLHPTPFFDDSYAVNSANNGPYGDAIMNELIPYLEEHFRVIREPYARLLTGGSTGGWESLALQLYHPDFFGGTWTLYPDPIDFRRYGLVNVYVEDNAFTYRPTRGPEWLRSEWFPPERPFFRADDGQPIITLRQLSRLEAVLGSKRRSGGQLAIWEAVYGPVGEDGYPKPLWDPVTGKIDHAVAGYMRDHGYDLRQYAETHWPEIGPKLVDKLHLYCGDQDNAYLNLAVYLFEDFLEGTHDPHDAGEFRYGRPMKGHGWQPMPHAELVKLMADHIVKHTPEGATQGWHY